jgi:hypothetical protein
MLSMFCGITSQLRRADTWRQDGKRQALAAAFSLAKVELLMPTEVGVFVTV